MDNLYGDLNLNFIKSSSGDIEVDTNTQAIFNSLRNIVLTKPGERRFRSTFGSGIEKYLAEPFSDSTALLIKENLYSEILRYEYRIKIVLIEVIPDSVSQSYTINIVFHLLNLPTTETTFEFVLRAS